MNEQDDVAVDEVDEADEVEADLADEVAPDATEVFAAIVERLKKTDFPFTIIDHDDMAPTLRVDFPRGRGIRSVRWSQRKIPLIESVDFEKVRFLGHHEAFVDT